MKVIYILQEKSPFKHVDFLILLRRLLYSENLNSPTAQTVYASLQAVHKLVKLLLWACSLKACLTNLYIAPARYEYEAKRNAKVRLYSQNFKNLPIVCYWIFLWLIYIQLSSIIYTNIKPVICVYLMNYSESFLFLLVPAAPKHSINDPKHMHIIAFRCSLPPT